MINTAIKTLNEADGTSAEDLRCSTPTESIFRAPDGAELLSHMREGYAYCRLVESEEKGEADFIYLYVNAAFSRLTGLTDVIGRRVTQVIPTIRATNAELLTVAAQVARTGVAEEVEGFVPTLGIWVSVSLFCPRPGDFVAMFENITERKRAEQKLRESAEEFRAFFDLAPVGIAIVSPTGLVLEANVAFATKLRRPLAELVGRSFIELTHPDDLPSSHEIMRTLLAGVREAQAMEKRYVRADGSVMWAQVTTRLRRSEAGKPLHFITHIRDITEVVRARSLAERIQLELEQQVEKRTAELAAANKELEAFAYSVAHDLRAPLRSIDGFASIALRTHSAGLSADGREALEIVCSSSQHMGRLIDDLLVFSRLNRQSLRIQRVAPGEIVRSCLTLLHGDLGTRQIDLQMADLPPCDADPGLLHLVWMNLLSNALKYSRKRERPRIEIGCETGATPIYFVRDNGVGFKMAYADKLFGVFQRLHRSEEYEGTGVGLATAQRIVHRHGGRIWAEAEPDRGATFYFTLTNPAVA